MDNQPSRDNQFLLNVKQNIDDNLQNENYSVENLASSVGLSRSHLHRKLKRLIGKTATELITEVRLNRAKELLENDVATVSEIAYRVGFNTPSYFNKVFKKHFNSSPGEIKKSAIHKQHQQSSNQEYDNQTPTTILPNIDNRKIFIVAIAVVVFGVGVYSFASSHWSVEKSIAVLPLNNLTGQVSNDYFVEGMHDALIGELGQIGSVRVISRTSTLRYRESDMLLKNIAEELGVNTIVEGSVIGAGDSLRILIQLIDVFPKERHILSKEYHDDMPNVLSVQSSVVKDIAKNIKLKLTKEEELLFNEVRQVNPETYKAYLRGMFYINQGTKESFEKGIHCLYEAIENDPGDPFAYGGLAIGYTFVGHGQLDSEEAFLRATSAANKAIKLDPTLDEAFTALSILYLYNVCDWPLAKEAFEHAINNNPNNEVAHAHFAWYHLLFDDKEKTLYHAKKAVMIEPFSGAYNSWLALLYYHFSDYNNSQIWAEKSIEIKENIPYGNLVMSWVNLRKKDFKEALKYNEKLPSRGLYWKTLRGYAYVKTGQREKALEYWNDVNEYSRNHWVNTCHMGMMAAYLGYSDKAFELLNDAADNKIYPISYINFYPCTEDIRQDPRYGELLQKINLPSKGDLITAN